MVFKSILCAIFLSLGLSLGCASDPDKEKIGKPFTQVLPKELTNEILDHMQNVNIRQMDVDLMNFSCVCKAFYEAAVLYRNTHTILRMTLDTYEEKINALEHPTFCRAVILEVPQSAPPLSGPQKGNKESFTYKMFSEGVARKILESGVCTHTVIFRLLERDSHHTLTYKYPGLFHLNIKRLYFLHRENECCLKKKTVESVYSTETFDFKDLKKKLSLEEIYFHGFIKNRFSWREAKESESTEEKNNYLGSFLSQFPNLKVVSIKGGCLRAVPR